MRFKTTLNMLAITAMAATMALCGCRRKAAPPEPRKRIGVVVENYDSLHDSKDSVYHKNGIYRVVTYRYNYKYKDSIYHTGHYLDRLHSRDCFLNEYMDTVSIVYTDYTNGPTRSNENY